MAWFHLGEYGGYLERAVLFRVRRPFSPWVTTRWAFVSRPSRTLVRPSIRPAIPSRAHASPPSPRRHASASRAAVTAAVTPPPRPRATTPRQRPATPLPRQSRPPPRPVVANPQPQTLAAPR
ncbi:hypothetical protein SEVIR_9G472150v4 [Setaria viridis]